MIDFTSGIIIGLLAALAVCGVWWYRAGWGEPLYVILGGAAAGYVGGLVVVALAFVFLLGEAFRPQ